MDVAKTHFLIKISSPFQFLFFISTYIFYFQTTKMPKVNKKEEKQILKNYIRGPRTTKLDRDFIEISGNQLWSGTWCHTWSRTSGTRDVTTVFVFICSFGIYVCRCLSFFCFVAIMCFVLSFVFISSCSCRYNLDALCVRIFGKL